MLAHSARSSWPEQPTAAGFADNSSCTRPAVLEVLGKGG
jgi:hypothetical protein